MAGVEAYIDKRVQTGIETTAGTPVATTKKLQTLMWSFQDSVDTQQTRPQGQRFDARSDVNKRHTVLGLTGELDYIESLVALEMWLGAGVLTTPSGAVLARQRVYDVPMTGAVTPKTRTMQYGDSVYADQFAGAEVTGLGVSYNRDSKPALTGAGYALLRLAGGTTFSGGATSFALQPVLGSHLNFYLDDTGAGLGTTQISEEVLSAAWTANDIRVPFWAADRSQSSYKKSLSNSAFKPELKLTLGYSSAIRTIIDALTSGATKFFRIQDQGPLIEATTPNYYFLHQADMAIQLSAIDAWKNDGEVFALDLTFDIVGDTTWGHGLQITSVTNLTSL